MAIEILIQKDYLLTEVSIGPSATPQEIDELMRALKTNAKVVTIYNGGKFPGINIEQRTQIAARLAPKVRELLGIGEKEL